MLMGRELMLNKQDNYLSIMSVFMSIFANTSLRLEYV